MQATIKYCFVLLVAVSVAPVIAEEDSSAPSSSASDVLTLKAPDDDAGANQITFRTNSSDESTATSSDIDQDEADGSTADSSTQLFQKTAKVAITKSDTKPQRRRRPPVNTIPGLRSDTEMIEDDSETTSEIDLSSDQIDPEAEREVIQERYKSGILKIRREMTLDVAGNYVKHGQWTMFSEAGEEIASGKFLANQRHGPWRKIISPDEASLLKTQPYTQFDAPFLSEANFEHGQLTGTWTIRDSQGRLASEWTYEKGKLHGKAKWFYPDGNAREEIDYRDGLIDGSWIIKNEDGTELENSTHQKGRKLAVKHDSYENGVKKWEGIFLHETFVVNTVDDWWNTRPVTYKAVGYPERHGEFTSWYENGEKKFSGTFRREQRTGEFTWWHENTQVAVQGSFVDGERHGLWVWWHENGQKAIQGHYENGQLHGPWSYWSAEGKLERKVDYTEENQPVAVHPVPGTSITARRLLNMQRIDQPVGTGVRIARRNSEQVLRGNPVRKQQR